MAVNNSLNAAAFAAALEALGPFENRPEIAVACSGGIDSMTLALLAREWAERNSGQMIAVTIDHALRPESAMEAEETGKILGKQGIRHHILRWEHGGVKSGVQAKARQARYALLSAFCRERGILHLLTGHNRNDDIETYIMREKRGSGMMGLASVPSLRIWQGVRILRPLLQFSRSEISEYLQGRKVGWVEDSSNACAKYERNRLRGNISATAGVERGIASAAVSRAQVERKIASALPAIVELLPQGIAVLNKNNFVSLDANLRQQLLQQLITAISGKAQSLRRETLLGLESRLCSLQKTATLGGVLAIPKKSAVFFCREAAELREEVLDTRKLWDDRFEVYPAGVKGLTVGPLTASGWAEIKKVVRLTGNAASMPKAALYSLPVFRLEGVIVAVPQLEFMSENRFASLTSVFRPERPLTAPYLKLVRPIL